MTGVVAVIAAAAALSGPAPVLDPGHLPRLPLRGFVRETTAGVMLVTMRGRPLGLLRALRLADDKYDGQGLLLRDRRGRLFMLDLGARRVREVSQKPSRIHGCRVTDYDRNLELLVCGHTIKRADYLPTGGRHIRTVARGPSRIGHWVRAEFSPLGDAFLAQWSAECEVPVAFLVTYDGQPMKPYGGKTIRDAPSSVALGWLVGRTTVNALVHFPNGACGGTYRIPGIYEVPRNGRPRLVVRTPRFSRYWMWGG
jgi:hypothetical protein